MRNLENQLLNIGIVLVGFSAIFGLLNDSFWSDVVAVSVFFIYATLRVLVYVSKRKEKQKRS